MGAARGLSEGSTAVVDGGRSGSLPVGLASMPTGPGLAGVLASVDRSGVVAQDLPELVRARARLLAFVQAEFLLDLVEAAHGMAAEPGSTDRQDSDVFADDAAVELGWVLCWSPSWTAVQLGLARDLVVRLPMVLQALRAGRLDRERAFAFADSLRFVDDEVARSVAAKLVDRAQRWTLGQLRDKLRYHIDRADPAAKRRRYRRAVAERGVWLHGNEDGTANLTGVNLPPHRAAAAFDRVDRLARAARRDGDVRNLAQLRADAFTNLLAGVPFQLCPSTDPVTAEADAQHPGPDPELPGPGRPRPARRAPRVDPASAHHHPQPPDTGNDANSSARPSTGGDGLGVNRRGSNDASGNSTGGGRGGDGTGGGGNRPGGDDGGRWGGVGEPGPREDPGRIDLYDYEDQCLTDEDRWWLHQLRIGQPGAAAVEDPDWWATCRPTRPTTASAPSVAASPPSTSPASTSPASTSPVTASPASTSPVTASTASAAPVGAPPANMSGASASSASRVPSPTGAPAAPVASGSAQCRFPTSNGQTATTNREQASTRADVGLGGFAGQPLPGDRCACGGRLPQRRPAGVDVHVELTTLIGRDEHPALIPGLGPIPADLARLIAVDPHTNPAWRWSVFDHDAQLRHHGYTTHRPTTLDTPAPTPTATDNNHTEPAGPQPADAGPAGAGPAGDHPARIAAADIGKPGRAAPGRAALGTKVPGFEAAGSETTRTELLGTEAAGAESARTGTAGARTNGHRGSPTTTPCGGGEAGDRPGDEPRQGWCRCVRYDAAPRRAVVELHLTTSTLAELAADPALAPGYQAVIADIAAQVEHDTRTNPPSKWTDPDEHGTLRHHGHTGRHPDAAEAAFIRARDRSCRTPNCRTPARKCEIDHRIEHAKGGPSHRGNCDCRCKRHHGIRHRTGFHVTKHGHTTIWTTRNGRTYPVPPDKDINLTGEE